MRVLSLLHLSVDVAKQSRLVAALRAGTMGYSFDVSSGTDSEWLQRTLRSATPDLVLLDFANDALQPQTISDIKSQYPQTVVVVFSACDEPQFITACLSSGADDFLAHSCSDTEICARLVHACLYRRTTTDIDFPDAVGTTMQTIAARMLKVLKSAVAAVHVCGESGTGKEVVASIVQRIIAPRPLVTINCGGVCPALIGSELFGHRKGSFTGALQDHRGYVEQADGGWLFLDEVASLDHSTQSALLRVLENQEVVRVGETKPRQVDVRILSASNVPITNLVQEGKFRLDLWQRLCELEIKLPPLRARQDEIPALVAYFLSTMKGGPWRIAPEALQVLRACSWHDGNVRELRNCLRTMSAEHQEGLLTPAALPSRVWQQQQPTVASDKQELRIEVHNAFRGRYNVTYEVLNNMLLLECVRENFRHRGRCGVREFAATFNLPPSTASRRLHALVDQCLISNTELTQLIAIDGSRN